MPRKCRKDNSRDCTCTEKKTTVTHDWDLRDNYPNHGTETQVRHGESIRVAKSPRQK